MGICRWITQRNQFIVKRYLRNHLMRKCEVVFGLVFAGIAQLVVQHPCNVKVRGSSPFTGLRMTSLNDSFIWRDVRVVYGVCLESRWAVKRSVGSNPTFSAEEWVISFGMTLHIFYTYLLARMRSPKPLTCVRCAVGVFVSTKIYVYS